LPNHQLSTTLKNLRGNARACVYTEPLWGIPYNLYAPYASIYMLAFGLSDSQIGLITSIGLAVQIFWTILSRALTDKFGRKRTTLIFDILSWSVPCVIWALSQNFTYFLVAAIVNSAWRVPQNSWQCLLVEDTDPHLLFVDYISSRLS
jgi:DHA1 family tetracycline resistance protein-like MFS transporter